MHRAAAAALAAICAAPALAATATDAPVIQLDYAAPPDCPSAAELTALVVERLAGRRVDGPLVLSVSIVDQPDGGKRGRLRRWEQGVPTAPRELHAAACDDLVRALALTAALSVAARTDDPTPGPTPPPPTPTPPAVWSVGASVSATLLLPPHPMAAGGIFVDRDGGEWTRGPTLHAPELALAVVHARSDVVRAAGEARFTLTMAALTACPLGWGVLRACALGEAGALEGRGIAVDVPVTNRALWLAAGGLLKLRATAAGGRFVFEAHAGVRAPLRREAFVFVSPRVMVATVPAVVPDAGLAAGLSFW